MKFKINDETLKAATNCTKKFSCLDSDCNTMCKVKAAINDSFFFIECQVAEYCAYKKNFGGECYCICPTRKEIFNKYRQ
jgi:hypothetical protein